MKASLNLREDQKPLVRVKIPLSILGFPFLSGVSAGDSKELRLDLSTAFDSGPSVRVSYRPNDYWNPFSLVVKTGIGAFGSPIDAPMSMSAEFNLLARGGNPSFSIMFKPRLGDFCIKKMTRSSPTVIGRGIASGADTDGERSLDGGETPIIRFRQENGNHIGKKINGFSPENTIVGGINGLLSGAEVTASSVLPLRSSAAVRFRWGVRIPAELRTALQEEHKRNPTAMISIRKVPQLVMNKISIEHVAGNEKSKGKADVAKGSADVAQACLSVKRQLESMQAEKGLLRKAVEELRSDLGAGKFGPVAGSKVSGELIGGDVRRKYDSKVVAKPVSGKGDRRSDGKSPEFAGKVRQEDVNEELKKALMNASGAGI